MKLPRFSLRLLFVTMALLCAWLAWERSAVQERRAVLDGWTASGSVVWWESGAHPRFQAEVSWIRRCFGDAAVARLFVSSTNEQDEFDLAKRLFPEAEVKWAVIERGSTLEVFVLESRDQRLHLPPSIPPMTAAPLQTP